MLSGAVREPRALPAARLLALGARGLFAACAFSLALAPTPARAWGFAGHRMVAAKAVRTLPEPLRRAFEGNAGYLVEQSINADLQRSGPSDPDHFLDLDAFGVYPFDVISHVESENLARFGKDSAAKGRLPWRLEEVYRGLVDAFRARDLPRALERAGTLCHLVADAHVPLHATDNHDGQLTGQRGLHARWESDLVERNRLQLEAAVQPAAAARVAGALALAFDVLRESYLHSVQVLASDREVTTGTDLAETAEDDRYDDEYYSRLYAREASRLAARLGAAASATGSLWLSAWEEGGRPDLDASYRVPYVRHEARAILLSLDGAALPVLDDAVARDVMPNLAQLRRRGAFASRGSLTTLPSKTAAGHAALYTGAWSDRNGITGNEVTPPSAAITETGSGYSSVPLQAEPIWAAAARQDLDVTVVSATQVHPFSTYLSDHRFPGYYARKLTLFDGYQNFKARDRVYGVADLLPSDAHWLGPLPEHEGEARAVTIEDLGVRFDALLYDDPRDPTRGFDTLLLTFDRDPRGGIPLKPSPVRGDASAFAALAAPLAGGEAAVYFRLFALAPDGSALTLYRTAPFVLRSNKPRLEAQAFETSGGFVGNGASWTYERGQLGPPLWEGGDGTAERRYLETVALVVRQVARLNDFALDRTGWELLLTYLPYPDEALHLWYGYLDPGLPSHDRAIAARLRPFLDDVLRLADGEIGHLVRRAGKDTIVAVAGDHGFVGVDRELRPNVVLRQAGLLNLDAEGKVDLARTRAYYSPAQYLLVNRAARPRGIVNPSDEEGVRRAAIQALRGLRGPRREPIVLDVLDPRTPGRVPSFGGPAGGDLYLSVAPGYNVSARLEGEAVERTPPRGEHFLDPQRPAMHVGFVLAGAGVASGKDLGEVRQTDIAPTLCFLLGIEPPAEATGAVLGPALARTSLMPPWR